MDIGADIGKYGQVGLYVKKWFRERSRKSE